MRIGCNRVGAVQFGFASCGGIRPAGTGRFSKVDRRADLEGPKQGGVDVGADFPQREPGGAADASLAGFERGRSRPSHSQGSRFSRDRGRARQARFIPSDLREFHRHARPGTARG